MRRSGFQVPILLIIFLLAVMLPSLHRASATTYAPGVKTGDWWQYGNITGKCNNPCQVTGFTDALQTASIIVRITKVTGANLSLTVHQVYQNGTSQTRQYSGDLATGLGNLPDGLAPIAANLNAGDNIFNSTYAPTLNYTTALTIAGATRQANVWNDTATQPPGYAALYFDKPTGVILAGKAALQGGNYSYEIIGTNLWPYQVRIVGSSATCTPSDLTCRFLPDNITIDRDTTVFWNNTGLAAQTVTACQAGVSDNMGCPNGYDRIDLPAFDSGIINAGSSFTFTFDVPGTYHYYSAIDPWIHGTVYVQANTTEKTTDGPPDLTITSISPSPAYDQQTVTLKITGRDPDGNVTSTWVDWGDSSLPDLLLNMTSANMCQRLNTALQDNACTIAPGSIILARSQNSDPSTILNGSIIVFRPFPQSPSLLVVSRVIAILPPPQTLTGLYGFITQGDANSVPDCWPQYCYVPSGSVVAVYQSMITTAGNVPGQISDTHTFSTLGNDKSRTYNIQVYATDEAGSSSHVTMPLTVNDQPPTATVNSLTSTSQSTGTTLTVSFTTADPDGAVESIKINWGDGTNVILTGATTSSTHTYTTPGTYIVTVTATDNAGITSQPSTQTFTAKPPSSQVTTLPTIFGLAFILFIGITAGIVAAVVIAVAIVVTSRKKSRPIGLGED